MKFSPYHKEKNRVDFKLGGGQVMLMISGNEVSMKRFYDCDLFGCGLQVVTMETDPFRAGDTYQVCHCNSSFSPVLPFLFVCIYSCTVQYLRSATLC